MAGYCEANFNKISLEKGKKHMAGDQSMNHHDPTEQQINDAIVNRYFDSARGGTAATVSMSTISQYG